MALQLIPGRGAYLPELPRIAQPPAFSAAAIIDASAEKIAFIGHVFNKDRATKTLDKIHFRTGAVTFNVLSALRVSVQNVNLAAGPPAQPDGTQDQFRDITLTLAANTWTTTGLVTSDGTDTGSKRSIAFGDDLCIVFEYQTFTAADSVVVSTIADLISTYTRPHASLFTASWASLQVMPNVVLEFSDGTFGTLDGSLIASAISAISYDNATSPDEYAMPFSLPFPSKVDGGWALLTYTGAGSDLEFVLYDGTTAMTSGTVAFDGNTSPGAGGVRYHKFTFADAVTLAANTTYRLAVKPTTTNNVSIHYFDVAAAGHLQALDGGESFCFTGRVNAGAWDAATTTRRPYMGIRLCGFDDAAGAVGGLLRHPGMSGGIHA